MLMARAGFDPSAGSPAACCVSFDSYRYSKRRNSWRDAPDCRKVYNPNTKTITRRRRLAIRASIYQRAPALSHSRRSDCTVVNYTTAAGKRPPVPPKHGDVAPDGARRSRGWGGCCSWGWLSAPAFGLRAECWQNWKVATKPVWLCKLIWRRWWAVCRSQY